MIHGDSDKPARSDFSSLPESLIYLNNGTEGSMPDCVRKTYEDALVQWAADPTHSYESDPILGKFQARNREAVARFLKVGHENICLTDNTTMGCSMTLLGLHFEPGDRVVTTNHEHPAIRAPLKLLEATRGIRVLTRNFPPASALAGVSADRLIELLFPNREELTGAKALCVSHVYAPTGVRLPLLAMRKKADQLGIQYLIVDGAQAVGMLDLTGRLDNIRHSDFYAGAGHKWLNGPPSTGILYISEQNIRPPEFYPTLSQRVAEYMDDSDENAMYEPAAAALQIRGCSNTPGFAGMVRALQYQDEAGFDCVQEHCLVLSKRVKDGVASRSAACMVSPYRDDLLASGLTTFFPFRWDEPQTAYTDEKTCSWVVEELMKHNIQIRTMSFPDVGEDHSEHVYALRVSTGHMNSTDQVETFLAALRQVLQRLPD